MQITFNEERHELTIKEDDGRVRRLVLYDNLWEVTYLILKAIDQLDDGDVVIDWELQDTVPAEKLPENTVLRDENGKIPDGLDAVLSDGDKIILQGGSA